MKFTVSTALKRAGAGLTLGAALLTVSGCGYIYTQPTTLHYAASDGVHSTINGNIELRNIMVVSHGKGAEGRVLGTVLNKGNNDATVTFNFPSGAKTVNVPKGQQVRLEQDDHKLVIPQVAPQPGETLSNTRVSVGDASGTLNIPVMDGTLKEYKPYLPGNANASASASRTGAPSASHAATPSGSVSPSAVPETPRASHDATSGRTPEATAETSQAPTLSLAPGATEEPTGAELSASRPPPPGSTKSSGRFYKTPKNRTTAGARQQVVASCGCGTRRLRCGTAGATLQTYIPARAPSPRTGGKKPAAQFWSEDA